MTESIQETIRESIKRSPIMVCFVALVCVFLYFLRDQDQRDQVRDLHQIELQKKVVTALDKNTEVLGRTNECLSRCELILSVKLNESVIRNNGTKTPHSGS